MSSLGGISEEFLRGPDPYALPEGGPEGSVQAISGLVGRPLPRGEGSPGHERTGAQRQLVLPVGDNYSSPSSWLIESTFHTVLMGRLSAS